MVEKKQHAKEGGMKRKGKSQPYDKSSSSSPSHKKFKKDVSAKKVDDAADASNSAKRRQLKKERQSHRKHADIVNDAKSIWNKLRLKTATIPERTEMMEELMSLLRGKMNEVALQHDASRVVQAAIQFGTPAQRKEILIELCKSSVNGEAAAATTKADASKMEQLPELSKIQYAHFVTLKLIKYCAKDDECVTMMVKSFKGTMPKLAVHSVASRVLEAMFLKFPPKATMSLKQEFYGPHFSLFFTKPVSSNNKANQKGPNANASLIPTLKSNLELEHTTDAQRKAAVDFVKDLIQRGLTKGFFGFAYFQELVAEYMDVATPNDIRDMASSIVDHSLEMLSTRAGSKVVAACASYGTPKDRKRMLKNLKGYTRSSLLHKDAYLALLQLIQVTDDTVSTQKSLLNELVTVLTEDEGAVAAKAAAVAISKQQDEDEEDVEMKDQDKKKKQKKTNKKASSSSSPLLELAMDNTASKLFLLLLVREEEARMKYFDTYERTILASQPMILEKGQQVPTSKKDPQSRVQELLQHLSPGLTELCSTVENVKQLIQSVPGSRVLKEVYAADLASEPVVEVLMKICVAALQEDPMEEDDAEDEEKKSVSLFEDPVGHWLIKNIILYDAQRTDPTQALFSKAFVEQLGDQLMDVAKSNRGAFVVAALLKVPAVQKVVRTKLDPSSKNGKQIQKLSKASPKKKGDERQPPTAGYEALWKELSSK